MELNLREKDLDRELRIAQKQADLRQIRRTSWIREANDLISFATRKISATALVGIGGSEILSPDLLSGIKMGDTTSIGAIAIGLGILGGKQLSDALNRIYGNRDDL